MRIFKVSWVFFLAVCQIVFVGASAPVMASHATHFFEAKGPGLPADETGCYICHGENICQKFADGNPFATTTVCNSCHSPNGAYNGVDSTGDSVGAKDNWQDGVYEADGTLSSGKDRWCVGCHDDLPANSEADGSGVDAPKVGGDDATYGFYATGHGRDVIPLGRSMGGDWVNDETGRIECQHCHDASVTHIDGEARTYAFNSAYCDPLQSGEAYAEGYRLRYVDGEVPLMIPANYNTTFGYNAMVMRDTAFRLCFNCHSKSWVLDDVPADGLNTAFKASLPNPPRNYSYAWGGADDEHNEHVIHIMMYTMEGWDSDWDMDTDGGGPGDGTDSMRTCSSCHNVHGAAGALGSTNESMIRDGSLSGRTGYGFSYVIEDAAGYPWVTSDSATRAISVGAIMRNGASDMCYGACHGFATTQEDPYDATGSAYGTILEWYRPGYGHHMGAPCTTCHDPHGGGGMGF